MDSLKTLDQYRLDIDAIDHQLQELLQKRAQLALDIGHLKKQKGKAIYDPEREKAILNEMTLKNSGPLKGDSLRRIFEAIIRENRALEEAG